MPEQAADDAADDGAAGALEAERRHQVGDDVVVVARVERDVVAAGVDDRADDVERLVAVEGRDLDRDHALDLGEAPPEGVRERPAADGRLQVEADDRQALGDPRAVREEVVVAGVGERGEAEQAGVVAEAREQVRLGAAPARVWPQTPRDAHERCRAAARPRGPSPRRRARAPARSSPTSGADRELRGVDADRQAAGAGGDVVARQRALAALVELRRLR